MTERSKEHGWLIQYKPDGLAWLKRPGWYYGSHDGYGHLGAAAVGPFGTAQEAAMDLTRAFVAADALGPVEERPDGTD